MFQFLIGVSTVLRHPFAIDSVPTISDQAVQRKLHSNQMNSTHQHHYWMTQAIALAKQAGAAGEVPVGAVVVGANHELIAQAENRRERDRDPTAHAEILALRAAGQVLQNWHLNQCTLYVTLEPCPMCAGAIIQARMGLLVYGASDPKTGAIRTVINLPDSTCSYHRLSVLGGILEVICREQLQTWFAQRRQQNYLQKQRLKSQL